ncbi:hypothetical protein R615_13950 [Thalassolituus oleivorans R6-15]|nr:hypothetical protein R615_13950 [Thalassolituus oleivorans R6-15]
MKASYRLTSLLITLLYLLFSLPGWQSLSTVTLRSTVDWSQVLHPVLLGQIAFFYSGAQPDFSLCVNAVP